MAEMCQDWGNINMTQVYGTTFSSIAPQLHSSTGIKVLFYTVFNILKRTKLSYICVEEMEVGSFHSNESNELNSFGFVDLSFSTR